MMGFEDPFMHPQQQPQPMGLDAHPAQPFFDTISPMSTISDATRPMCTTRPVGTIPPTMLQPGLAARLVGTAQQPSAAPVPEQQEISPLHRLSPVTSQDAPLTPSTVGSDQPRRDAHMASEQRRRAQMKSCFETIERLLPKHEYRKSSKANTLQATVNYLKYLQEQQKAMVGKIKTLQMENAKLSQLVYGAASPYAQATADRVAPSRWKLGHRPRHQSEAIALYK